MANDIIFTPWRLDFILSKKGGSCVFCDKIHADPTQDADNLVLYRGHHNAVFLNLYPYATGHTMTIPYQHTNNFVELDHETLAEMTDLTRRCVALLGQSHYPTGFNIGINLGAVAGAGIADHLHQHCVPRWLGDNNFMSVTSQTRLMPELLSDTYAKMYKLLPNVFEAPAGGWKEQ